MTDDNELLRRYAVEHADAAFAELVQRHVDLVYSAALRLVNGDAHRAQDIAQQVFAELARQAKHLARHPAVVGWLYTTTRLVALRTIRTEQRRSAREHAATIMNELLREPAPELDWEYLSPLLEDAMHELGEKDRTALLLRYFQNKNLKEVGGALGLGENAARMRVERALEKLRVVFTRQNITPASLASVISINAVQTAPAHLTTTITAASIATAGAGTFTFLKIMTATQLKIGISALIMAGAATALVVQHQTQTQLRAENESLREQFAQLKADDESLSNRLAITEPKKLSGDQLDELLRLRGEVNVLRNQSAQLGKLRDENQHLRTLNQPGKSQPSQISQQDQFRLEEWHTVDTMKYVGLAMRIYSGDHNNALITNFDQIIAGNLYDTNSPDSVGLDRMELMSIGQLTYDQPDMILFREKNPRRTLDGKWERAYGMVDGSVQTIHSDDGNFDGFEKQHSPPQ